MIVRKKEIVRKWFFSKMRTEIGKEAREGIHLTDVLYPRKCFMAKTVEIYPTEMELLYFIAGRGHEAALMETTHLKHGPTGKWHGIWFSPDIMLFMGHPAEFKTMRKGTAKDGEEEEKYHTYLDQLKGYCVMLGKSQGYLIVLSLVEKFDEFGSHPAFTAYRVIFSKEELTQMEAYLDNMYYDLTFAIDHQDPSGLPYCPEWMCARKARRKVEEAWCLTCSRQLDGRSVRSHLKKLPDHEIQMPEYNIEVLKTCRFFDHCYLDTLEYLERDTPERTPQPLKTGGSFQEGGEEGEGESSQIN